MEDQEHRRKFTRHPVRWKAAVVFDKADGKPLLHTHTHDLSAGGAAIHSNYSDLTGSQVVLLLAEPVRQIGETPKMLKIRARVVSSVHSPAMSGFRHGLRFVPSKDDSLEYLAGILGAAESARSGAERVDPAPRSTPVAERGTPFLSPDSALAQLRQAAFAKQTEEQKPDAKEQMIPRVSGAIERAYNFLKEFSWQLNLVKPAYAKYYAIAGVPRFDDLKWADVRFDFRTRATSPTTKLYEQLTLSYRLSADKSFSVTRDAPADEKLKQVLLDTKIEFTAQQKHNDRGSLVRTTFVIPCEVKASLQLVGNFDTGKLLLRTRNVEHFSVLEHVMAPEAITEQSLNELAQFILGESKHIGPLILKGA